MMCRKDVYSEPFFYTDFCLYFERDRETDRQTDSETDRQTDRRQRETETVTDRQRQTDRHRNKERRSCFMCMVLSTIKLISDILLSLICLLCFEHC